MHLGEHDEYGGDKQHEGPRLRKPPSSPILRLMYGADDHSAEGEGGGEEEDGRVDLEEGEPGLRCVWGARAVERAEAIGEDRGERRRGEEEMRGGAEQRWRRGEEQRLLACSICVRYRRCATKARHLV